MSEFPSTDLAVGKEPPVIAIDSAVVPNSIGNLRRRRLRRYLFRYASPLPFLGFTVGATPPAQNLLRFLSYNEARTTSENFIDCELLTKVKTLTFSNEFISSIMWRRPSDIPISLSSLKLNNREEHAWRQP